MSPRLASSAWVIPGAFLVALAAIAGVVALQVRVSASHRTQVALVDAHRKFDALQNRPYDVMGQTPRKQAIVLRRIDAGSRAIERSLADLRRASPDSELTTVEAPLRENIAGLRRIARLLIAGKGATNQLGLLSGRLQRAVDDDLHRAGLTYAQRASTSLTIATIGSSVAILVLVSMFGLFYFRARRAQQKAQRLADQNASILAQDAQLNVIHRLALAAEYRDDETGQHTRRVGDLSERLGAALGMPEEQLKLLRQAAPLHDVGKIGIPDSILLKPGRLTSEEFDQMKAHTTLGAEMLAGGHELSLLAMAEQIALTHHERWDGGGYPAGLSGTAIPLVGRSVAVADVFDALTHSRPYKSAWTVADAVIEIQHQSGRQFDPDAVDAFMTVLPALTPSPESDPEPWGEQQPELAPPQLTLT